MPSSPRTSSLRILPANEATWDDLQTVLGERGDAHRCQCQWFKTGAPEWRALSPEERAERLRAQTECGQADGAKAEARAGASTTPTTGLIAYLDDEPVGWCAVEPRTQYPRLLTSRIPWSGREESKTDESVWVVSCFVTRTGYRRSGVSKALAAAAVDFARNRGARALEGYPIAVQPGQEFSWGELFVGTRSVFAAAGFREVSRPTERRVVMRIDFDG